MNNCVHCGDPTECASDGEYPIHDWSQYDFWEVFSSTPSAWQASSPFTDEVRRHCLVESFRDYNGRPPTPEELNNPNIVATPRRDV